MKKIALEEAVVIPGQKELISEHATHPEFADNYDRLIDITQQRIEAMDATDIDISVLSVTSPGLQGVDDHKQSANLAQQWNDYLAKATSDYSDRLKVFASLPTREPELAAKELQRCVKELGFVGALINGYDNAGGLEPIYYDAPQYLDFWKTAAELNVPIYIHPRSVPADRITTYSEYPELNGSSWGFHIETAEHVLRLILSGLFDKVNDLQIVIGHAGEFLPFWAWRIDHRLELEGWRNNPVTAHRPRQHTVTEYLQKNFYVTTSGYFETSAFMHTLNVMGVDRVMYAVDYPYEDPHEANSWFNSLPLELKDKQKIAYDNAAKLLNL